MNCNYRLAKSARAHQKSKRLLVEIILLLKFTIRNMTLFLIILFISVIHITFFYVNTCALFSREPYVRHASAHHCVHRYETLTCTSNFAKRCGHEHEIELFGTALPQIPKCACSHLLQFTQEYEHENLGL